MFLTKLIAKKIVYVMGFYCHNKTKKKFIQTNLLELFSVKLLH